MAAMAALPSLAEDGEPESVVVAQMKDSEAFERFWEFATTVRRTRSLAASESARLRGAWLTPDLAVQRVHGWGQRSVRLLCVRAGSVERRARLVQFFQKDRRNLEGRLVTAKDPLDNEARVLVKVPYDASLDAWVTHERRVLSDLANLPGVPVLAEQIYFDDIGIRACAYEYCSTPTMQEQLESGHLVAAEGLHRVAAFILATFQRVHDRGWLHTDLQPHDVLIRTLPGNGGESLTGTNNIICSWSHAVRSSRSAVPRSPRNLVELTLQLPIAPASSSRGSDVVPLADDSAATSTQQLATVGCETDSHGNDENQHAGGPSIYSAPEQFVGLFAGASHDTPATDVYRAAGVTLMALRGRGPLGTKSQPMERTCAQSVDALRRVCHEGLLRRAEGAGALQSLPPASEAETFIAALQKFLGCRVDVAGCGGPEMEQWLHGCLAREPGERYQTVQEALEALDAGWSNLEARLIAEMQSERSDAPKEGSQDDERPAPVRRGSRGPQRVVLEPPPELEHMTIL